MLSYSGFMRELRHALNHLYEPQILRLSPLHALLVGEDAVRQPMALGNFLVKAIEAIKPPAAPGDSPAWQTYEFLYYRYVQGLSQVELGQQLNCSERQVRRLQNQALAVLAETLLQKRQITVDQNIAAASGQPGDLQGDGRLLKYEYDALLVAQPGSSAEVTTELIAISDVLQPLLLQHAVDLRLPPSEGFRNTSLADVVFRQAFLSILAAAVHLVRGGQIEIAYSDLPDWIVVHVRLLGSRAQDAVPYVGSADSSAPGGAFAEAASLLALGGADLSVRGLAETRCELLIRLPAVRAVTVLAVDDNKDILQLLTRYATGTRYQLVTCSDPAAVLALAARLNPAVITLDVMMAGVDGWQLLRQLRQQPATLHTPIVICSVLAQEELARALGVSSYVRKPVSQDAYLAALDLLTSGRVQPSPSAHQ